MHKAHVYLRQLRVNHWIKNLILFLPLFFGGGFGQLATVIDVSLAFLAFSLAASAVYLINDLQDLSQDRKHSKKSLRPLAAGLLTKSQVYWLLSYTLAGLAIAVVIVNNASFSLLIAAYLLLNLGYTYVGKRIPIFDIVLLSSFYLIRLYAGAVVSAIDISIWLFTAVFFGAMVLVIGKRFEEKRSDNTRSVLRYYSLGTLRTLLLVCELGAFISYVLYATHYGWTYLPLILILLFVLYRYQQLLTTTTLAENPEILMIKDRPTLVALCIFLGYNAILIYS